MTRRHLARTVFGALVAASAGLSVAAGTSSPSAADDLWNAYTVTFLDGQWRATQWSHGYKEMAQEYASALNAHRMRTKEITAGV